MTLEKNPFVSEVNFGFQTFNLSFRPLCLDLILRWEDPGRLQLEHDINNTPPRVYEGANTVPEG
jgi:hypothetical protein